MDSGSTFPDPRAARVRDAEGKVRRPLDRPVQAGRRKPSRDGVPPVRRGGRGPGHAAEKSARASSFARPVPQTDTGGQVEQTEVLGRNHVKELGKPAP